MIQLKLFTEYPDSPPVKKYLYMHKTITSLYTIYICCISLPVDELKFGS